MAKQLSELGMTVAQFLQWSGDGETRYELVHGRPVAMASPSARHAALTRNLFRAVDRQVRAPCSAWFGASVARAPTDNQCRVPDLFVSCEPPPDYIFTAPRLIVEVLSPSTEQDDRTAKLDFYKSLPSVEAILLVWQEERRVQLHTREEPRWPAQDFIGTGSVALASLAIELALDEIYAGIELPAASDK